ncbi:PIN domain-like protein, partial [Flammula alnicola]
MRIFFFKLCRFLHESPAVMVFVFDGPNRPSYKHGRHIDTHSIPEWCNLCKNLIESFGFYWHQVSTGIYFAPGEAEAELARLCDLHAIDVALTGDSDAFVFGAQYVLRSISRSKKYDLYSIDAIQNTESVELSRGGLLLIALLSKSDYSNGLPGCGLIISAGLARCGFGDEILHAFHKLEDFKLSRKLIEITEAIKAELQNNTKGHLNSTHPNLASKLNAEY